MPTIPSFSELDSSELTLDRSQCEYGNMENFSCQTISSAPASTTTGSSATAPAGVGSYQLASDPSDDVTSTTRTSRRRSFGAALTALFGRRKSSDKADKAKGFLESENVYSYSPPIDGSMSQDI